MINETVEIDLRKMMFYTSPTKISRKILLFTDFNGKHERVCWLTWKRLMECPEIFAPEIVETVN